MFHSVSLFSQAPLVRGSRALLSVLFLTLVCCSAAADLMTSKVSLKVWSVRLHLEGFCWWVPIGISEHRVVHGRICRTKDERVNIHLPKSCQAGIFITCLLSNQFSSAHITFCSSILCVIQKNPQLKVKLQTP